MRSVIVFAKYPQPGGVKTRMIGPLTPSEAAELHRLCLMAAWGAVNSMENVYAVLAISPDESEAQFRSLLATSAPTQLRFRVEKAQSAPTGHRPAPRDPQNQPCRCNSSHENRHTRAGAILSGAARVWPQGTGSLGDRLNRITQRAMNEGAGRVVLLGCDCPAAGVNTIDNALDDLETHDMVLGPAADGGYYLLGVRRRRLSGELLDFATLFRDITWSTDQVAAETRDRAKAARIAWKELPIHRDLDRWEDAVAMSGQWPAEACHLSDLRDYVHSCMDRLSSMHGQFVRTSKVETGDIHMADTALPVSRVLIIDDNLQNLELLEAYLEIPGIQTIRATNGQEALTRVADSQPDLLLLDIMMPRMSGFEVCKKLKSDPVTADIPVIMVTALTEVSDVERGVESGTDDFVSKPVNRQDLVDRVTRLLKNRQMKKQIEAAGGR